MADLRPRAATGSFRILSSGWRLASAQAAFFFAGGSLLLFGLFAVVVPGSSPRAPSAATMWTIALATTGGFAALGLLLRLLCRHLQVDVRAGLLRLPGGKAIPLADLVAVAIVGRKGTAPTGSGGSYRYTLQHLLAVRRGGDVPDFASFAPARGPDAKPLLLLPGEDDRREAFLREPPPGRSVLLVDAASSRRATRAGARLAGLLQVPFLLLPPVEDPPSARGR